MAMDVEDPLSEFMARTERPFARLVLGKPRRGDDDVTRVTIRPLVLRGAPHWSFVYTHATRDVTKNLEPAAGRAELRSLAAERYDRAHLQAADGEFQLLTSRKGRRTLLRRRVSDASGGGAAAADVVDPMRAHAHDREKRRVVDVRAPFLAALGVTDERQQVIPAMARKWKQINRFVEVLDGALAGSGLLERGPRAAPLQVLDFGSGKGYLTFAAHAHLQRTLGVDVRTTGVELRGDLVALCNDAARRCALDGLRFEQGDVSSVAPARIDVMIALHACDTATDHAIATGVRAGAAVIVCAPCCHKELRPQLLSPHPLRPILKHGVHLGQQAEMITDGLRALLLEAFGYETQVFEFVSLEHTSKNKMILGVKRAAGAVTPAAAAAIWQQIEDVKTFYGVRDQCLAGLLADRRVTMPDSADSDPLHDRSMHP